MICTNCGSQVPDNQKFCTNCGAAFQPAEQAERSSMSTNPQTPSKRNKRKIIVIIIIVVLILSRIGAGAYFTHGFGLLDKKEETKPTAHLNPTQKILLNPTQTARPHQIQKRTRKILKRSLR